jgi:hypothetical protein
VNFAGFALIWAALAMYSIDSARGYRAAPPADDAASAAPPTDLPLVAAAVAPEA